MKQVTLVTGAASGIGRAIASHLHARGHAVVGLDRAWGGGEVRGERLSVDVGDEAATRAAVRSVIDGWGQIDAVVHAAAVTDLRHRTVRALPLDVWEQVLRVNATGSFIVGRAVLDHMIDRDRGNIVFVTSSLGLWKGGILGDAPYSASKAAVEMLAHVLALETAATGLNVNTLYPSVKLDTGFFAHLPEEERRSLAPPSLLNESAAFLAELPPHCASGESVHQEAFDRDPAYARRLMQPRFRGAP